MRNCMKMIFLLAAAFVLTSYSPAEAATDPYSGVWKYKVRITVTNPTGGSPPSTLPLATPNDYPVRIYVPAKTYIDAGYMNSDMRDIRFADSNGNPLPFWINVTEGMVRTLNNIPVYVKLYKLNAGDNTIYMYFDKSKTKNSKTPKTDGSYTASDTTSDYCGDYTSPDSGTPDSPYTGTKCGDSTFGKFALDCTDADFNADASCKGTANARWVSKTTFGSATDAVNVHFRLHFYNHTNFKTYFMLQGVSGSNPQTNLDNYCGYRLRYEHVSTSNANDTLNQDSNKLHIEINNGSTHNGSNCSGGTWTDISNSPLIAWGPYNNSIQDLEIKVTASTIGVFANYQQVGATLNRVATGTNRESWTGGYAGFNRGDFTEGAENGSNSSDGISPIWFINNYIGADPTVTFMGNTDIMMRRIAPTADATDIGKDIINYTPTTQILEDNVEGNNLEKYVYSGYPSASPTTQTFKTALTITNRSNLAGTYDTFDISLTQTGVTDKWNLAFDSGSGLNTSLPGTVGVDHTIGIATAGTPTTGSVTLAAGASKIIYITAVPSADALYEGAFGRLILDVAVKSRTDSLFDNGRFVFNVNGKTGCYWKWKMPIVVSYTDTNGTGSLVDYQVLVTMSGLDFTDARSDGADIVFTDANGTALTFWTKSFSRGTGTASYWVKVHNLAAGSPGNTIYMWWGNTSYSPSRSSKATFDFWEDWESDYSGVGAVVGCPGGGDGTTACPANANPATPADPHGWKNNPQPSNNFNAWSIQNKLDGKAVKAAGQGTNDFGPILAGGDMRWQSYEASYSFFTEFAGTQALYNPVYFQDSGNGWGVEFFANQLIFRPFGHGTDWTWARQINASAKLGGATFPANNTRYWVKTRVFRNPSSTYKTGGSTHLQVNISPTAPADIDVDGNFTLITPTATDGIIPDVAYDTSNGMIGFGGWDGGFSFDNIRVRKYTEPEPTCGPPSPQTTYTPATTNYTPIASLSTPVLTPPLLNGRSVLLNGFLSTFTWTGDLQAIYADCYVAGECLTGEDATKLGTISLWGKVNDTTPKGFGDQLKSAVAGDNNRTTINDTSWQANGRYIFTAYDSNSDGKISCTTTPADCIALGTSNAGVLGPYLGIAEASPYAQTTKLIKYARGQYVAGFPHADVRNQCSSGTADTCQWKLGDVAHSSPLVIGVPNMLYADPVYDTFRAANANRDLVAYAASNEGMLHAVRMSTFNTTTQKYTTDGTATELWAFVPNAVLPVLASTADNFHEYTNDGLLRAIDIKTTGTGGGTYKTVIVGSLRAGGQSLYAMDITDPRAANLMWEINNSTNASGTLCTTTGAVGPDSNYFANIGKTWSAPALGRLCEASPCDSSSTTNRWVAIIGSGFSPNSITNLSKTAYITFVDLETGKIIQQINVSTKPGNLTTNIGVQRDKYGYIQKVNFGDYYGALWRLDLTTPGKVSTMLNTCNKTVLSIATDMLFKPSDYATSDVTDAANLPQRPITSQPTAAYAVDSSGAGFWWVYFGTGVYDSYNSSYPYQRIYALKDTVSTPYLDSSLTDMTNTTATNTAKNSWFIGLGQNDAGNRDYQYSTTSTSTCVTNCINQGYTAGYCATACKDVVVSTKDRNERVVSSPTVYGGFLFVSTFTPNSTVCSAGSARFYAVSYETGSYNGGLILLGNKTDSRSLLLPTSGSPSTPIIYTGKSGKGQIIGAGLENTSTGGLSTILLNPNGFSQTGINLLLWRRVR